MRNVPALMALLALSLTACGDRGDRGDSAQGSEMMLSAVSTPFKNTDITGLGYAREFQLTDHHGRQRSLQDFKGKAVLVFFGYTHCPDVCPTTMAELAETMKALGPLSDQVQVLFVSMDPERDTPARLAEYVPAFDSRFVGLTGDAAAIEKVAKDFRIFYRKNPGKSAGSYTVDHTSGSFVFDTQGRVRLFVRHGQGIDPLVHDLKQLLAQG